MGPLILNAADHIYWRDGKRIPGISEIIQGAGLIDSSWFTEHSRDLGKAVHLACQLYDEGILDESTVDPVVLPYLEGWKKFLEESGFLPIVIERSFESEILGFAGTPDRYGTLNGDEVILEIKSGAIYFTTGIQLAAQDLLFQHAMSLHAKKRFALQLTARGKYKLTPFTSDHDHRHFLACLAIHQLKIHHKILKEPIYEQCRSA